MGKAKQCGPRDACTDGGCDILASISDMLHQPSDPGITSLSPSGACTGDDEPMQKRRNVRRWKVEQGIVAKFVKWESCSTNDDGPPWRSDNVMRNGMQSIVALGSLSAPETRTRGKSAPQPRHCRIKESDDECDTNTMPGYAFGSKRDIVHQSTTRRGEVWSPKRLIETVPGPSIGGEATRLGKFSPQALTWASANRSLVAGAVVDRVSIANQRSPFLKAEFARSECDLSGVAVRHEDTSREAPHLGRTGSSEAKICHESACCIAGTSSFNAQFRVCGAPGKSMAEEQDTISVTGVGASEDREGSLGGADSQSSEDERFNSSVKTDRFGFFVTSERRRLDVPMEILRVRWSKEDRRAQKWRTMIDNFDSWRMGKKATRFRNRVRKGVPDCVRGKVWQMLMGSAAMMEREPNKYADLVASDLPVEGPIEEDIPRTMYDHELFCRKSRVNGRDMLRRVLTAYGRYDREVQYCQGINYITSLFLLYMPEEHAFWMLVATMNRPCAPLRELFLPGMLKKAQEFQFVMDSLTKKHCEKLSNQILAHNLTPAMYATQWFLTAFTQRFPYDLVTRVWDMFLLEDWKVFYRVCLALFKSVQGKAAALDLENLNLLLRNMPPNVDAQQILDIAASIPLKHRHIGKRIALFSDFNARKK
ncbi:unnamed protein product [Ectocarpus sp. 6 AP-2014]